MWKKSNNSITRGVADVHNLGTKSNPSLVVCAPVTLLAALRCSHAWLPRLLATRWSGSQFGLFAKRDTIVIDTIFDN